MMFSLKVEAENPGAGEAPPNTEPVPGEKLQPLVHNTFYGPIGNIAQQSERFSQSATVGVPSNELRRFISDLLVPPQLSRPYGSRYTRC